LEIHRFENDEKLYLVMIDVLRLMIEMDINDWVDQVVHEHVEVMVVVYLDEYIYKIEIL
jgi:hypothetical protein